MGECLPGSDVVDLVGRDAEIRRLAELLAGGGTRLITVSGTPGVGKSALLSAVPALVPAGTDVWSVDLAASPPGADLGEEVVRELALTPTGTAGGSRDLPLERLSTVIGAGRIALVVDHADACAVDEPELWRLLDACPELIVVIATAHTHGSRGEAIRLMPLEVPPPFARWEQIVANPSARLFALRAEQVNAAFRLHAGTAETTAEIVRLVGGLPLAIELAAARSGVLTLDRLARELRSAGNSPASLDLLTSHRAGAPRGIREALISTRRLLSAREDQLFSQIAWFRGPFTFDAAVRMTNAGLGVVLDDLGTLIDLRLVEPILEDEREASFVMPPLVRAFAREEGGSSGADDVRRGALLRALAREAASAAARADESDAVHAIHVMRRDVGYELRRLAGVDPDGATAMAVDAASVLAGFADSSAIDEVLDVALVSGRIDRLTPADQARVWLWASCMLARSPDGSALPEVVGERWRRGMALVDDAREPLLGLQARLIAIGNGSATGDLALSARAAIEGRALAEAAALPAWLARFEVWSAAVSHARGDVAGAVTLAGQALARAQRIGDDRAIVGAAMLLNTLPADRIPADVPVPELEDALRLAVAREDPMAESFVLAALTQRELRVQDPSTAAVWCARRLAVGRRRGWTHLATISLVHAALIGVRAGDYAFAARMVGAVRADEDRTLRSMAPATREEYARAQELIRARLGSAQAARIIAAGGILSTLDAVAVAMRWLDDRSTKPHTPAPTNRSITLREQDVLKLVADGLTNKQIAERLGLSVKTVMHHSVAIYRKLGVRGRAEATATAYRNGLLRDRSEGLGA